MRVLGFVHAHCHSIMDAYGWSCNITRECTGHDIYPHVVSTSCRSPMCGLVDSMDPKDIKALAGNSMHVGTIGTLIAWLLSQMALVDTSVPRGPRLPPGAASDAKEEEDALDDGDADGDMPRKKTRVEAL